MFFYIRSIIYEQSMLALSHVYIMMRGRRGGASAVVEISGFLLVLAGIECHELGNFHRGAVPPLQFEAENRSLQSVQLNAGLPFSCTTS